MSGIMPWYILREWDNSGKLLSGGFLYFYESGTMVPKATYTDYTLTVPNTNPVQLDAGGAADIFLGDGAYRVLVKDADHVQIRNPIDGITSGGSGLGIDSNAVLTAVKVYNDLRALTIVPDVVYVAGAYSEGDGGQGVFQLLPGSTRADDDGIILTSAAGTNVYKRVFDGFIDPQWYGVQYGTSTDQTAAFNKAVEASVEHNFPALFAGPTYLTQVTSVTAGATIQCTVDAFFHAGSALTMTFTSGSHFDGEGISFGANLTPIFAEGVVPVIRLSWMGGQTSDEKLAKLLASTAGVQTVGIDTYLTVDTVPVFPQRISVDNLGGMITINSASTLSMNVVYTGLDPFITYNSKSYIGTVNVGPRHAKPEWFGAVGDNTTDDSVAMQAAVKTERVDLQSGASYRILQQINCPPVVTFYGDMAASMSVNAPINDVTDVPTPRLFLDPPSSLDILDFATAGQLALIGVGLAMGGNAAVDAGVVNGTFNATNSVIFATNATGTIKAQHVAMSNSVINALTPFTASAVDTYLDNVRDDSNYARRKFSHDSSFKDVYLEDEAGESATFDNVLTTRNADGLVEGKHVLHLESLVIQNITTEAESLDGNTTYIEFEAINNGGGVVIMRTRRDGVQIAESFSTPVNWEYQIQADDKPNIVVRFFGISNTVNCWIVPMAKPSGSDVFRVIGTGWGFYVGKGTVSPNPCWNNYGVQLSGDGSLLSANRMAVSGYYYGTKWSIG